MPEPKKRRFSKSYPKGALLFILMISSLIGSFYLGAAAAITSFAGQWIGGGEIAWLFAIGAFTLLVLAVVFGIVFLLVAPKKMLIIGLLLMVSGYLYINVYGPIYRDAEEKRINAEVTRYKETNGDTKSVEISKEYWIDYGYTDQLVSEISDGLERDNNLELRDRFMILGIYTWKPTTVNPWYEKPDPPLVTYLYLDKERDIMFTINDQDTREYKRSYGGGVTEDDFLNPDWIGIVMGFEDYSTQIDELSPLQLQKLKKFLGKEKALAKNFVRLWEAELLGSWVDIEDPGVRYPKELSVPLNQ